MPVVGSDLCVKFIHVVEKFRQVFIESGGECFGYVEVGTYFLKCSLLLSLDSRSANHFIYLHYMSTHLMLPAFFNTFKVSLPELVSTFCMTYCLNIPH
jgi:hypothetical protein